IDAHRHELIARLDRDLEHAAAQPVDHDLWYDAALLCTWSVGELADVEQALPDTLLDRLGSLGMWPDHHNTGLRDGSILLRDLLDTAATALVNGHSWDS